MWPEKVYSLFLIAWIECGSICMFLVTGRMWVLTVWIHGTVLSVISRNSLCSILEPLLGMVIRKALVLLVVLLLRLLFPCGAWVVLAVIIVENRIISGTMERGIFVPFFLKFFV